MENLAKLKARILSEAQAEAEAIRNKAMDKAAEITRSGHDRAERRAREIMDAARLEVEEMRRRASISLSLEERNAALGTKGELIDSVMDQIPHAIKALDRGDYRRLLISMIASSAPSGNVDLVPAESDRLLIDEEFIVDVQKAMETEGRQATFRVSSDSAPIMGGAILRTNIIEVDCSIEGLRKSLQEELEPLVAEALFGA